MSNVINEPDLSQEAIDGRIIFSMLRPAAYLAARLEFPLKDLTNFIRLSYFRELKDERNTLEEAAEKMDVSVRTAKRLNQELRSDFFLPEIEHTLARRIEFMLWAQPISLARILQLLPGVPRAEVMVAMERLENEGRLRRIDGRTIKFGTTRLVTRLVDEDFSRRIGALNSLLQNVAETVVGRFIERRATAFARTLSFRIRAEDVEELNASYQAFLRKMVALEGRVEAGTESLPIRLSILWSEIEEETG